MKLTDLQPGESAVILQLHTENQPLAIQRKMRAMGLLPQTTFTFLRRAPLGSGIELNVRGGRLCLRAELAQWIEVRKHG